MSWRRAILVAIAATAMTVPSAVYAAPTFLVEPYLQSPSTSGMTVMWETNDSTNKLYYRVDGTGSYTSKTASKASGSSTIYYVTLTGLSSNKLYQYYVSTSGGAGSVYKFKTWPNTTDPITSYKFVAIADTQGNYPSRLQDLCLNGIIGKECTAGIAANCASDIAGMFIAGDIVTTGSDTAQWRSQFFAMIKEVAHYVPIIPAIGNHDSPNTLYKRYFTLPRNGSTLYLEEWYTLNYLNLRLIVLNSERSSSTQNNWLTTQLSSASSDPGTNFALTMFHQSCKSELWPAGEGANSCGFVTKLENFTTSNGKPSAHIFGHTHGYSRGQSKNMLHIWMNVSVSGGGIDHWGEYPQTDYDQFEMSYPEYGFSVINGTVGSNPTLNMVRRTGGDDTTYYGYADAYNRDNITVEMYNSNPGTPAPVGAVVQGLTVTLNGGSFADMDGDFHRESQWQLTTVAGNYTSPAFDVWGNATRFQNIYYNNDTQDGIDITQYTVNGLNPSTNYYWRVRYRDDHFEWSDWSDEQSFSTGGGMLVPNMLTNPGAESGITGWTVTDVPLESLTNNQCTNPAPYSGTHLFALGGVCSGEGAYGEAYQRVNVSAYSSSIDLGTVNTIYKGWLRDYAADDKPEIWVNFLDASQVQTGTTTKLTNMTAQWTLVSNTVIVPVGTRYIDYYISGTRYSGTDNDSYLDDLSLELILP